jgi:3-deoxy-manno-octulosonate cytidylyltransferase (CMP-KDO synthetase)
VLLFVVPVAVGADETLRHPIPRTIAVIPARYESSRFPGKPLAGIAGRPMIEHVYRRVAASRSVAAVLVATDDRRVADAVRAFGGEVRMTRATHRSGTERLAEVAASLDCDLVVNVQGDEPLVVPEMIDEAIAPLAADAGLPMGTLRRAIDDPAELASPHVVKVVVDCHERALYFSRAPIPSRLNPDRPDARVYKHIGLYVYRRDFLIALAALPPTPLERAEMLEQLRALEHGYRVAAVETRFDTIGVDTPEDLERVRALFAGGRVAAAAP